MLNVSTHLSSELCFSGHNDRGFWSYSRLVEFGWSCSNGEANSDRGYLFRTRLCVWCAQWFTPSINKMLAFQTLTIPAQLLLSALGIIGAGVAAWIGVKIALAQQQKDINTLFKADEGIVKRVDRIEDRLFFRPGDKGKSD